MQTNGIYVLVQLVNDFTSFFSDTTVFTIIKLALRGNEVLKKAINRPNHNIYKFDSRRSLPKYLSNLLNNFKVMMVLGNRTIILEYWSLKNDIHSNLRVRQYMLCTY